MSRHVLGQLSAHLDGELPRAEESAVLEHLASCDACRLRLEQLASLDATARALPSAAPPGYFERLPARVRARLERRRKMPRLPVWGLAAAAALALLVLTPPLLRRAALPAATPPPLQAPGQALQAPGRVGALSKERSAGSLEVGNAAARPQALPRPRPGASDRLPRAAPTMAPAAAATRPSGLARHEEAAEPHAASRPAPAASAHAVLATDRASRQESDADLPLEAGPDRKAAHGQAATEAESPRTDALAEPQANAAGDIRFAQLLARDSPKSVAAARALSDAWQAFARDHPSHARSDEARVRALEACAQAYRLSQDARDRERLRADATAYLARPDAAQAERVRTLLRALEP